MSYTPRLKRSSHWVADGFLARLPHLGFSATQAILRRIRIEAMPAFIPSTFNLIGREQVLTFGAARPCINFKLKALHD
jgi:hypothetical protein